MHATLSPGTAAPGEEIREARWVTPAQFSALRIAAGDIALREYIFGVWPAQGRQG